MLERGEPGTIQLISQRIPSTVELSNLLDLLRCRRGLFGSAAVPIVVVGACAFPDYTFEPQTHGSGGVFGGVTTGDVGALTGCGGIPATGTASSGGGAMGSSSTSTTGTSNSGGSAGGDFGGAAGETADGGSSSVGGATTNGAGGSFGGVSGGFGGSGDNSSGSGGSGANGACGNDSQCASEQCDDGWCRPEHCGNDEPDVYETDTDCGGAECRPCGYEQHCLSPSDCATLDCSPAESCRAKLVISCSCNSMGACNLTPPQTMVDLQFENTGSEPISLEGLRFHYYYSAEGTGTDTVSCDSVNFTGGTCSLFNSDVRDTGYDDASASDEVVFWFTDGTLDPGATTGSIRFSINGNAPYQRSNDYSFQNVPTDTSVAMCDRIVVMNADDVPIWGLLPD